MTCSEYRASQMAALDGEPAERTAEEREAHAASCSGCAAEWQGMASLCQALNAWPDRDAPVGLAERALALCLAEAAPERPRQGWKWLHWLALGPALGAAALAAVLWAQPVPAPEAPQVVAQPALTQDEEYALAALRRAGVSVVKASDRSQSALGRVAILSRLKEKD